MTAPAATAPPTFPVTDPEPGVTQGPRRRPISLRTLLVTVDVVTLGAAWATALALGLHQTSRSPWIALAAVLGFVGVGVFIYGTLGLYRARVCSLRPIEHARLARAAAFLAVVGFSEVAIFGGPITIPEILVGASLSLVLSVIARGGYRNWVAGRRRDGAYLRPVLLIGCGEESLEINELLECHPELGYRPVGVLGDPEVAASFGQRWCGGLDDLAPTLMASGATGAIVCATALDPGTLNRVVNELLDLRSHVQLSSGLRGVDIQRLRPLPLAREPLFYVEPVTLAHWQLVLKRTLDLVGATAALLVSAPLLAAGALAVKLEDHGPMLFRQVRVGRDGRQFVLYKLRTMRLNAESELADVKSLNVRDGPLLKIPDDPRISRIGRFLRATSIDELPQLWNVLNGTMSLVGPRPALPDEVAKFDDELRARAAVRPGITGLWQIEGRDNPSFAAYRRFDLFYVKNWSIGLDLMILGTTLETLLARTARVLFFRKHGDIETRKRHPTAGESRQADLSARRQARRRTQVQSGRHKPRLERV